MKRWTIRILLCLILVSGGAATTVGVAWGSIAFEGTHARDGAVWSNFHRVHQGVHWSAASISAVTFEYVFSARDRRHLDTDGLGNSNPERVIPSWCDFDAPTDGFVDGSIALEVRAGIARGWPLFALAGQWEHTPTGVSGFDYAVEFHIDALPFGWQYFPLRPIIPGFIINTLFYAAIWFGIFFAVGFAKRTIRKKRGRCLMCNYDLRGAAADVKGCPECGWNREP